MIEYYLDIGGKYIVTKKYEVELFEGDWGILIGRYDTLEEAEEEYESWNNSRKLYKERKDRL